MKCIWLSAAVMTVGAPPMPAPRSATPPEIAVAVAVAVAPVLVRPSPCDEGDR